MIVADIVLDGAGLIKSCRIEGHALAGVKGGDIVCAAVSVLARTALRTLSESDGVAVSGFAPTRGAFGFDVEETPVRTDFTAGVTAFLLEGLRSIACDYPDYCIVRVRT
jgi:hypothetical protein